MDEAGRFLSKELLSRAGKRKNEYVWRWKDILFVASAAEKTGFACTGGQAQFHAPDGTFEINWSSFTPEGRKRNEPWDQYVIRSWKETHQACRRLITDESKIEEGKRIFKFIRETVKQEIRPTETLWFVFYFQSAESWSEIHERREEPAHATPQRELRRTRTGSLARFIDWILGR